MWGAPEVVEIHVQSAPNTHSSYTSQRGRFSALSGPTLQARTPRKTPCCVDPETRSTNEPQVRTFFATMSVWSDPWLLRSPQDPPCVISFCPPQKKKNIYVYLGALVPPTHPACWTAQTTSGERPNGLCVSICLSVNSPFNNSIPIQYFATDVLKSLLENTHTRTYTLSHCFVLPPFALSQAQAKEIDE